MELFRMVTVCCLALALATAGVASKSLAGDCCEPTPVCCKVPPVEVCWCVIDPCTGCTYKVSACIPAECACLEPTLECWKKGMLGRKVLTYNFGCCHKVDVVITKHGRTIVRD